MVVWVSGAGAEGELRRERRWFDCYKWRTSKQAAPEKKKYFLGFSSTCACTLTCKSTFFFAERCRSVVSDPELIGKRTPRREEKKGKGEFPHAPRRAGGFFSSRAGSGGLSQEGKGRGDGEFLGPAQRTGRGSICPFRFVGGARERQHKATGQGTKWVGYYDAVSLALYNRT